MKSSFSPLLSTIAFSILFALSLRPRHGYEIMQQIAEDSSGSLRIGASSLYTAIKTLREDNLIEEMPFTGDERRRYYRLTKKGWDRLEAEMRYRAHMVELARQRHLLSD
jgi:DNA-binding PadR family transcriptional regulator